MEPAQGRPASSPARPARRRALALAAMVALGGALLYAAFYAVVTPDLVRATDPTQPFGYVLAPDDDARVGQAHLVTLSAWSHRGGAVTATLWHRAGMSGPFEAIPMQRVGAGSTHAAELPPLGEGQRAFYFVALRDATGTTANVPPSAPQAPLPHVRWEDTVPLPVLTLHVTLMIGAVFFLIHALHAALLAAPRSAPAGVLRASAAKAHRAARWGWLGFFVGGIPLGIYVSGTALGWPNAWGGWPLGFDVTDTKTELLALYWGLVLVSRPDLWPAARWLPWPPWTGDRGFAALVLAGAALTAAVYAIPHSLFFQ